MSNLSTPEADPVGDGKEIYKLVLQDIADRVDFGLKKYGTTLRSHNGRSALRDAYQEALDLVMYLRQKIEEDESEA